MAVFVVVPLLLIVVYAFTNYDGKFTLENFTNLDVFLQVCGNSLYLAAVATGICLLIAYPFAYFLAQTGPATRKVAMLFIMLPMWMNFLLRTYAWMSILENHGFLNQILALVGIGPLHIINTDAAVILGMVYNFLPFMILPIFSVIEKLDRRYIEAAQDLGAGRVQVFRRVIFPLSVPGVISGIMMVFIPSISTFAISKLLGGGMSFLLGDLIEMQFLGSAYNPPSGQRHLSYDAAAGDCCHAHYEPLRRWRRRGGDDVMQNRNPVIAKVLNVLVFLFLYLPIAVLIIFSFNDSKSRTVWSGFSLHWYQELFQDEEILSAFSTTLTVSVLAALIATVLGTAAAIGFHAMKRRPRHLLMTINNIPMTNADIITGVSLMLLFVFTGNMLGFSLGFGTLLVAHITFNIPYVVLAVLPKLRQLNPNLGEAAMDLGATPWQAFWKVLMPELRPGILNGLLIAFTLSIDDFVISYFTAGSEVATLAMQIYAMTRKRISPEVNALSTILFVTVLALLLIVNFREMHQTKQEEKRNKALQKDGVKGGAQ